MANKTLKEAKSNKKDEFYTLIEDISEELNNYKKHFKDKVVLCNCDDPEWSNFWIFFHQNFEEFGLKKLISTHYNKDGSSSYVMEYTGGNDVDPKDWHQRSLKGNGDFASEECIELLKEADITCSNPPFSLFRSYLSLLIEHNKKFIIWANNNCITYKEVFPLIKENKMWLGYMSNKTCHFRIPNDYEKYDKKFTEQRNDGYRYATVPAISTFTNLDIPKRHFELLPSLKKEFANHPELYQKYDNYDAINVDKVKDIPYDYYGIIGVPITFIDKYNPDEFEIINLDRYVEDNPKFGHRFTIDNKETYARILIRRKEYDE